MSLSSVLGSEGLLQRCALHWAAVTAPLIEVPEFCGRCESQSAPSFQALGLFLLQRNVFEKKKCNTWGKSSSTVVIRFLCISQTARSSFTTKSPYVS